MVCCNCFDKYAWVYNKLAKFSKKYKKYAKAIIKAGELSPNHTVLDVGGGTGHAA